MDQSEYRLIHEYYSSRIRFGFYQQGDTLPSANQLCSRFKVARQTVRKAFLQLQNEGYISVSPGRLATVIYQPSSEEVRCATRNYFLERKDVIEDVNISTALVMYPLLREGCSRLSQQDLAALDKLLSRPDAELSYASLQCCLGMLEKLHNPLVIDLYDEAVLYYQFPCFQKSIDAASSQPSHSSVVIDNLAFCCRKQDRAGLLKQFLKLQERYKQALIGHCNALNDGHRPALPQVAFQWRVYRDRPQYCYTLVSKVIHKVMDGAYPEGSFLPSFAGLASAYGVSFSTARRAVALLSALGVVRSINGRGSQVHFSEPDLKRLREPATLKNFDMLFQSIELLCLSCDHVIGAIFPSLCPEGRTSLCAQLRRISSTQALPQLIYAAIYRLMDACSLASLRAICDKLYEFLFWGYPFLRMEKISGLEQDAVSLLLKGLENGDASLYSQGIKVLFAQASLTIRSALQGPVI